MRNSIKWLLGGLFLVGLLVSVNGAAAQSRRDPNPAGTVVCAPNAPSGNQDCLRAGPVSYLDRMAEVGIIFPLQPLRGTQPPPEIAYNNLAYARVTATRGRIYNTLEAAVEGKPVASRFDAGFLYVTYIDTAEVDGKRFYMIDEQGRWMRGDDLSRVSGVTHFQGLAFNGTPKNAFGWVLFERFSKRTPGFGLDDYTEQQYFRYNLVQIYHVEVVDEAQWFLIGPDEWLEGRLVSGVFPNTTPPEGVENGRWIDINLEQQTLAVYEDQRLVFGTVVASGVFGQWTRPGLHQAYKKVDTETMRGSFTADRSDYYYIEGIPWAVYFDEARALHGAFWHNGFGVPQSRGCVNLSTGDAYWVFDWIQEGDWIYVHDPSGQTPTDPALYGAGGA
jgi:hypothetical protein